MSVKLFCSPCNYKSPHRVSAGPTDYGRAVAISMKYDATSDYNDANAIYSNDISRYNEDNTTWDRVGPNMPEPDHTSCYDAMNSAYVELQAEQNCVNSAYDNLGAAQAEIYAGDAATDPQVKTQDYSDSCGNSTASENDSAAAGPHSASINGYLTTAEGIMAGYG